LDELETVLAGISTPTSPMTTTQFNGFITSISLCPDPISASQWLPVVLEPSRNGSGQLPSETKLAIRPMMDHWHAVSDALATGGFYDPFPGPAANVGELGVWRSWILGFLQGMAISEGSWLQIEAHKDDRIIGALTCVKLLAEIAVNTSAFDSDLVDDIQQDAEGLITEIVEQLRPLQHLTNCEMLEVTSFGFSEFKGPVVSLWGDEHRPSGYCQCGSRKKYRLCCGAQRGS
jgi:uncharacterized protein